MWAAYAGSCAVRCAVVGRSKAFSRRPKSHFHDYTRMLCIIRLLAFGWGQRPTMLTLTTLCCLLCNHNETRNSPKNERKAHTKRCATWSMGKEKKNASQYSFSAKLFAVLSLPRNRLCHWNVCACFLWLNKWKAEQWLKKWEECNVCASSQMVMVTDESRTDTKNNCNRRQLSFTPLFLPRYSTSAFARTRNPFVLSARRKKTTHWTRSVSVSSCSFILINPLIFRSHAN